MRRRPYTLLVALTSVSMLSAACGLKPAQLAELRAAGTTVQSDASVNVVGGAPGPLAATSPGSAATRSGPGSTGLPGSPTTTGLPPVLAVRHSTGSGPSRQEVAAAAPVGKCGMVAGAASTGITSSTINIGVHAPQTGTGAPLPPSFADGVGIYWKTHKVCGRTVNVDFQDDKYTPPTARAVCEPMSRRNFLIVGAAGTDQIQSCATDPAIAGQGVPYLSSGVTTNGLAGLANYFAISLTFAQQGDLVLKNAVNQGYAKGHWAVVTMRTDNTRDAREAILATLTGAKGKAAGVSFDPSQDDIQVDATNDSGLQSRAVQTGTTLATRRYDVVFFAASPGYFLYMSQGAAKQGFTGQYTGPGVSQTAVTVAQLICNGNPTIKANFLAPYPGIDRATDEFKAATGGKYDDIYWSLWGMSQMIDQALQASASLTRPDFIASLQKANLPGGVYAPMRFNGGHFGGTATYSQKVNCTETEPNQTQPGSWDTVGEMFS